jgi:drug/metabolite transporter (DMT)-like permease
MSDRLVRAFPLLFVVLWSTGFIGARLGMPHAEPLTFLLIRYGVVIAGMALIALVSRAPWPQSPTAWLHIGVTGVLVHGVYLGGVFTAISKGLPAGVASLVVGVQPLLAAAASGYFMGNKVHPRQWLGLALGFVGVTLVLSGKLGAEFELTAVWPAVLGLLGITCGTLYQKRFCPSFDWRTGAVVQFIPAALGTAVVAFMTEQFRVQWTGELFMAIAWLVLVLSFGAISLLNWLIRNNTAVNVASLFYLVPPCTALFAWLLFGDTFSLTALLGLGVAVWGVYLARQ